MTPNETKIVNRVRAYSHRTTPNTPNAEQIICSTNTRKDRIRTKFCICYYIAAPTHKINAKSNEILRKISFVYCMHESRAGTVRTLHENPLCTTIFGFIVINFSRHFVWLTWMIAAMPLLYIYTSALCSHCSTSIRHSGQNVNHFSFSLFRLL